ncbi:ATP-binding protein [Stygiolobus caldivivus]|uniref:AAA ATPase n=1 Tax=Stygiolobus caldivivus TaxID=2824673 RepID=A0A8D5U784_9CREN|nr:ATP-binding protein [Stygiolobus caldivivus]BCU70856.1 hypothetical protein KN1_21530 [Stygiolobus caldivivus]
MICNIPKVTVTTWSSDNIVLAGPTYRQYLNKSIDIINSKDVASIIGQPGMGKTTILRKAEESCKGKMFTFFLDLASKNEIEEEFWSRIDRFKLREIVLPKMDKKKYGYSFFKKLRGLSFESHLEGLCNKLNDPLLRLYCVDYSKDFDGMLRLIGDLKAITDVVLFIDEVRDFHLSKIHRLINSGLAVPVLMAIPTDAYNKVTDLAIRRRLDESRISLDSALTSEDIKEIIEAYCKPLADELYPIILSMWNGKELNTVSSILQYIKSEVDKAINACGKEEVDCVKEKIKSSYTLKDVESDSKTLEKMIRETINSLSKELEISYVHPRGKRVEIKGKTITVGIFFIYNEMAYIGLVKLMNSSEVDLEAQLLSFLEVVEHDKKEYKVAKKFIITNGKIDVQGVETVELSTLEVVRIIRGDNVILDEKVRNLLKNILIQKDTNTVKSPESEVVT